MGTIVNYAASDDDGGGASHQSVNEILAVPRYKRADLVRHTIPKIDHKQIDNWLRFGYLDLDRQFVAGTARDFRRMAEIIEENENLGPGRRYTGGDMLKVMLLQTIGQIGLPYRLGATIIPLALARAADLILNPDDRRHGVIAVIPDGAGDYDVQTAELVKVPDHVETEWIAVIDADRIIKRFLASPRGRRTEATPRDRERD
jgi:hypothetical protein